MRGKTNIGGGGVPLNAYIENMIVASGNIDSGDFVQYYTQPRYIEQSARNNFLFNTGGYSVSKKGNGLALFKNGQQIDEFSTYSVDAACAGNGFIFIYSSSSSLVASLRIVNDEFVLVDTINILHTGSYPVMAAGDGKVCLILNQSKKYIYGFSVSSAGELTDLAYLELSSGDFYNYYSKALVYYDEHFYYLGVASSSGSSNALSFVLTVASNSITYEYVGLVDQSKYFGCVRYQNENMVLFSTGYGNTLWNVLDSGTSISGLDDITTIGDNYKLVTVADRSGGGSILKLYQLDANTNELSLLFTKEVTDERYKTVPDYDDSGAMGIISGDYIYLKLYDSENLRIYKIVNANEIQDVPQTGYVIPYSQAGKPIGVAKDSGMVGDHIDVYVPVQSV